MNFTSLTLPNVLNSALSLSYRAGHRGIYLVLQMFLGNKLPSSIFGAFVLYRCSIWAYNYCLGMYNQITLSQAIFVPANMALMPRSQGVTQLVDNNNRPVAIPTLPYRMDQQMLTEDFLNVPLYIITSYSIFDYFQGTFPHLVDELNNKFFIYRDSGNRLPVPIAMVAVLNDMWNEFTPTRESFEIITSRCNQLLYNYSMTPPQRIALSFTLVAYTMMIGTTMRNHTIPGWHIFSSQMIERCFAHYRNITLMASVCISIGLRVISPFSLQYIFQQLSISQYPINEIQNVPPIIAFALQNPTNSILNFLASPTCNLAIYSLLSPFMEEPFRLFLPYKLGGYLIMLFEFFYKPVPLNVYALIFHSVFTVCATPTNLTFRIAAHFINNALVVFNAIAALYQ
jgi:hypothetical protein